MREARRAADELGEEGGDSGLARRRYAIDDERLKGGGEAEPEVGQLRVDADQVQALERGQEGGLDVLDECKAGDDILG